MEFFGISEANIVGFVMVATRIAGLFAVAPIFGSKGTPPQVRGGIALVITFALAPIAGIDTVVDTDISSMIFGLGGEFLLGLSMGFLMQLLFTSIQAAGQTVDMMIGFAMANIIDPLTSFQATIIGQFYNLIAVLVFFTIDGHILLIRGLAQSFSIVPVGQAAPSPELFGILIRAFGDIFIIALMIAAPVVGTIMVVDMFLGVMAKAMPRMNVFFVGFPLRIGVGLVFVGLGMTYVVPFISDVLMGGLSTIGDLMLSSGGG